MKSKHLISILDLSLEDIVEIYAVTMDLKSKQKQGVRYTPLVGKTLAMIFSKPSTRTRVSFEVGIYQLGGLGLFLSGQDMQLRRGETIGDTAKTLSRYVNGIMIRTFSHKDVEDLAKYGSVPVINGLTDLEHPCQALADIFTVIEHKCRANTLKNKIAELKNLKFVYVGDGNNVAHSLMLLAAKLSMNITVITPSGYEPDKPIVRHRDISKKPALHYNFQRYRRYRRCRCCIYRCLGFHGKDSKKEQRVVFLSHTRCATVMSKQSRIV